MYKRLQKETEGKKTGHLPPWLVRLAEIHAKAVSHPHLKGWWVLTLSRGTTKTFSVNVTI